MNPEQRVAVLQDLLQKVRSRARTAGVAGADRAPMVAPRGSAAPSMQAFRRASVTTDAQPSAPAGTISLVPQTLPEERRTSVPAPVLLRAVFASSPEVALFRGEVLASAPPRNFSECS